MKRAVLGCGLLLALATIGVAQVPTIDNFTLEKFQKQRLAAERDYRANYAQMGFPSPEELDRQRDEDLAARIQIADQLRQARLEGEKIELERRSLDLQQAALEERQLAREAEYAAYAYNSNAGYQGYYGGTGGYGGYYSDPYYGYNGRRYGSRWGRYDRRYGFGLNGLWPVLGGYRATAVGVYPSNSGIPLPSVIRGPRRGGYVTPYRGTANRSGGAAVKR